MKKHTVSVIFCVTLGFVASGHTETIYIKNEKGSDTMILRTKPSTSTPSPNNRPRREYSDEQVLQIAPSIRYESTGRPIKPGAPNAPSRPYRHAVPQE